MLILPNELEIKAILSFYDSMIHNQINQQLEEDRKEYLELHYKCLTSAEKTKNEINNFANKIFSANSESFKSLCAHTIKNFTNWLIPDDEKASVDFANIDHINQAKKNNDEQLLNLKQKQSCLNKPIPTKNFCERLFELCKGFSSEALIWYIIDARIKQYIIIQSNIEKLISKAQSFKISKSII